MTDEDRDLELTSEEELDETLVEVGPDDESEDYRG